MAAIDYIGRAIAIDPNNAPYHSNLGNGLGALERFDEAIAHYDKAIALAPLCADAHYNKANILHHSGRSETALGSYRQALALKPDWPEAHTNLGVALQETGALDDAILSYRRAIALKPDHAEAHWNLAFALLITGRFAEGWRHYEWRWLTHAKAAAPEPKPDFQQPQWAGEPSAGGTILVWSEQGLGDCIQFIRYGSLALSRGWTVVAEMPRALIHLFRSIPGITVIAKGDPRPPFDVHCPLLSLPLACATDVETIPRDTPYLNADGDTIARWRDRFPSGEFRIGIAWQGNRKFLGDTTRSIPLRSFARISQIPNVRLYSLQKNAGAEQLTDLSEDFRIESFGSDFDTGPDAFRDTAAIMMHLDLIITSDTSIAHLAGALGRPVWLALKSVPDWRWMLDRDDSPWYPTMRLFRQTSPGDWDGVFARIADQIQHLQVQNLMTQPPTTTEAAIANAFAEAFRLHRSGQVEQARTLYRRVLERAPRHADSLHLLGMIEAQTGHPDQGGALIGQAVAINPKRADYITNLATALMAQGRVAEAVPRYRQALALAPGAVDAHYNLGNALTALGRLDEAADSYREAIRLKPDHTEAHNNLGVALQSRGQIDAAIASFAQALSINPDHPGAMKNLDFTKALKDGSHSEVFDYIYTRNIWERGSGTGSEYAKTESYRVFLQNFLTGNKITSVVDLGCGDWQISRHIDWRGISYTGIDVSSVVLENTRKFATDRIRFLKLDAVADPLPPAQLVIIKDVLQHWSNQDILSFLPKLKTFQLALITNGFKSSGMPQLNKTIATGSWRPVDVSAAPFNLAGWYIHDFQADEPKRIFLWINPRP